METRQSRVFGFALLSAGFLLCAFGLWLLFSPAQYRATTRIKLNPEIADVSFSKTGNDYDPYFIQTEFEVMQSQAVLGKVIKTLNLKEPINRLKRRISIRPILNTRLIEIRVTSENPDEAAKIANAIAEAYRDYRVEQRRELTLSGIKALEEHYKFEEQEIKTLQEKIGQLRKQLGVPTPEPSEELLKTNYPTFFGERRFLKNEMELHKLVGEKIKSEKVDFNVPKTSPVIIVDRAVPPNSSISPNRYWGAILLACGLIASGLGFYFVKRRAA